MPNTLLDGLKAYWTFDEGSGTVAADATGANIYNGFLHSAATWTGGGKINTGISCNGATTSWVEVTNNPLSGQSAFSVSAWINPSTTTGNSLAVVEYWGTTTKQILIRGSAGATQFFTFTSSQAGGTFPDIPYTSGSFQNFVFTYDGATMRAYKNGAPSSTTFAQTGTLVTAAPLGIFGGPNIGSEYYLSGIGDECGVWGRALSPTEILSLYNAGAGRQYPFFKHSLLQPRLLRGAA